MATFTLKELSLAMLVLAMVLTKTNSQSIDSLITGAMESPTGFDTMDDLNSGEILTELDMMLTKQQYRELHAEDNTRKKRKAIKATTTSRWPHAKIPYTIARGVFDAKQKGQIQAAINEWQLYTCIRFVETTDRDANRILFDNGGGCYSYVGKVQGTQKVGLAPGCRFKGIIVHEIGHAVGFHHEQNRPDRDSYVTIMKRNIPASVYYNFKKYSYSAISTYGVPYDYKSVMHYGGTAFSLNGRLTIKTKDSHYQNVIGNRKGLSFRDIKLANLMYTCNKECAKKTCPGEGFVGKDCKCWCPGNPVRKCGSTGTVKPGSTPKPTTPRPTTKPKCKDQNSNCPAWKKGGYCQTNTYVKMFCKMSCGTCDGGGSKPDCKDAKTSCPRWAETGYCTGTYEVFMSRKCAKSCNTCDMLGLSEEQLQNREKGKQNNAITQSISLLMVTIVSAFFGSFNM